MQREPIRFAAIWGGAGLLVGCALTWAFGSGRLPIVQAQAAQADPSRTTFAFTSTDPDGGGQLLYVVDTRTQAFAIYRVSPGDPKGAVKLEAARQFRWDLRLAEFNNQDPQVATIESMIGDPGAPKR